MSHRHKILIVTNRYYPQIGGIESHTHSVAELLSKSGCEITQLSFSPKISFTKKYNNQFHLHVLRTPFLFSGYYPLVSPFLVTRILKLVNRHQPHIIHTHNRYMLTSIVCQIIGLYKKIPVLHTEHAASTNQFQSKLLTLIAKFVDFCIVQPLLSRIPAISGVSKASTHFLKKEFGLTQVHLTPNFVDTNILSKVRPVSKEEGVTLCMFSGRFVDTKGYQHLCRFITEKSAFFRKKNIKILFAGGGEGVQSIRNLPQDITEYLGELSHKEYLKQLASIDIYINLSTLEGLPTTILEAIYFNKFIISTDIPPNVEALSNYTRKILIPTAPSSRTLQYAIHQYFKNILQLRTRETAPIKNSIPTLTHTAQAYMRLYNKLHMRKRFHKLLNPQHI